MAEIVREQVFLQYRQEVPYSASVACTDFKNRPNAKDYVEVCVLGGGCCACACGCDDMCLWL